MFSNRGKFYVLLALSLAVYMAVHVSIFCIPHINQYFVSISGTSSMFITATLAISLPMCSDVLMTFYQASFVKNDNNDGNDTLSKIRFERLTACFGCTVPGILMLLDFDHINYILLCEVQMTMILISVYSTLVRHFPIRMNLGYYIAAVFSQVLTSILLVYTDEYPDNTVLYDALGTISSTHYSIVMFICYIWVRKSKNIHRSVLQSASATTDSSEEEEVQLYCRNIDESTCLTYMTLSAIYVVGRITPHILDLRWNVKSLDYKIIVTSCTQIIVCITMTILPGRNDTKKAKFLSKKNCEIKRNYIRYISHEIRSPMFAIQMGIELLKREINRLNIVKEQHLFHNETIANLIQDISDGNDLVVEILDNMLIYDDMDKRVFQLKYTPKSIESFFTSKWKQLVRSIEARGIQVDVNDPLNVSGLSTHWMYTPEVDDLDKRSLAVNVDVEKINKVVGTLFMNAVKFTPTGCSINLSISVRKETKMVSISSYSNAISTEDNKASIIDFHSSRLCMENEAESALSEAVEEVEAQGFLRIEVTYHESSVGVDETKKILSGVTLNPNDLRGGGGIEFSLFISRLIIQMHGGTMGYVDTTDNRSTVFIEIPLVSQSLHVTTDHRDNVLNLPEIIHDLDHYTPAVDLEHSIALTRDTNECQYSSTSNHIEDLHDCNAIQFPSQRDMLVSNTSGLSELCKDQTKGNGVDLELGVSWSMMSVNQDHFNQDDTVHVVVADDSISIRRMMERTFLGYNVSFSLGSKVFYNIKMHLAEDGKLAVDIVKSLMDSKKKIACVLIDFIMIKMHGPEAVGIMRRELKYEGPIIGITGNVLKEDCELFTSSGVNFILQKPASRSQLFKTLCGYSLYFHEK